MRRLKGKPLYAYVAGIIDGEGSITLNRSKPTGSKYIVHVSVGNTNEWLIHLLKFQFGGNIYFRESKNPKWKNYWLWTIWSQKAADFLTLILPYLQIKRDQAELAISFQNRKVKGHQKNPVLDEADKILMLSLNKRGPSPEEAS